MKSVKPPSGPPRGPSDPFEFAGKPDGWERMDAMYIVAAPADLRFDRSTVAGPAVAFAIPMPDY